MDFSITQLFAVLAFLSFAGGSVPYVIDVMRGKTNPHKMAVVIFTVLALIGFASQLVEGATLSLVFPAVSVITNVSILLLMKNSHIGAITQKDKVTLALAILILLIWYITESAAIAIILLTVVNIIGKFLTTKKLYKHPDSELMIAYVMWILGSIFTALSVGSLNWILMLPAINNIVTLIIILAVVKISRKKRSLVSTLG